MYSIRLSLLFIITTLVVSATDSTIVLQTDSHGAIDIARLTSCAAQKGLRMIIIQTPTFELQNLAAVNALLNKYSAIEITIELTDESHREITCPNTVTTK